MAKNPDDRYSSMQELDERLAPFEAEASAVSLMPPAPGSVIRPTQRSNTAMRLPSAADVDRETRAAKLARPLLVALTFAFYFWLLGASIDLGAALLARARGAPGATGTEKLVVAVTFAGVSLTPLVFWVRKVSAAWKNSVRSVELADIVRRVFLGAILTYSFLVLAIRALTPLVDPHLMPFTLLPSLVAGAVVYGLQKLSARKG
jgi:serine/threonine-protein kinase